MSPTAAMNVAATMTFDPGDGHQSPDFGPRQRLGGDQLVHLGDLLVEKVDLANRRVDGLALAERQLLGGQPGPAIDPKEV
jgi:hypothetical protein